MLLGLVYYFLSLNDHTSFRSSPFYQHFHLLTLWFYCNFKFLGLTISSFFTHINWNTFLCHTPVTFIYSFFAHFTKLHCCYLFVAFKEFSHFWRAMAMSCLYLSFQNFTVCTAKNVIYYSWLHLLFSCLMTRDRELAFHSIEFHLNNGSNIFLLVHISSSRVNFSWEEMDTWWC